MCVHCPHDEDYRSGLCRPCAEDPVVAGLYGLSEETEAAAADEKDEPGTDAPPEPPFDLVRWAAEVHALYLDVRRLARQLGLPLTTGPPLRVVAVPPYDGELTVR